jgi:glycosyltransferase involved in cell wall biosynthesis
MTVESIVGISVYALDNPAWVKESIQSILNQTYQDFLLGVYIDGPVDENMQAVISSYQDHPKIVLFPNDKPLGLAQGINHLMTWGRKLSAEYYFRMDADDVALPDRLEKQITYLTLNSTTGVLGGAMMEFSGAYAGSDTLYTGKRELPLAHEQIVSMLPKISPLNHPTVCFRYSSVPVDALYETDSGLAEDYRLWVNLVMLNVQFANLPDILVAFRITPNFYQRRSIARAWSDYKARMYAIKTLDQQSITNWLFALGVLMIRLMPSGVVKFVYRFRHHLNKA